MVRLLCLLLMGGLVGLSAGATEEVLPDETMTESEAVLSEGVGQPTGLMAPLSDWREPSKDPQERARILKRYNHLDPQRQVPKALLEKAVLFFDANLARLENRNDLAVLDFSQRSSERRFFLLNMSTGAVRAIHVAHGKGSDQDRDGYAERFTNIPESQTSSLGFYLGAETYTSRKFGLALRMDGLSATNSNARKRAIVIHGADYVKDRDVKQGRSWGCPAVSWGQRDHVIQRLKNGTLIYAGLSKVDAQTVANGTENSYP
jgi:L,D-transpeptidase catalytic domain